MKHKSLLVLVVFLSICLMGLYIALLWANKNFNKSGNTNRELQTKDPEPQLKSGYVVNQVDSEWSILNSKDIGFSILIPRGSTISTGGGFDKRSPDSETSQLSIHVPNTLANAIIVINTGFLGSKTTEAVAIEISEQTGPSGFIFTNPSYKKINNATGFETFAHNDRNTFSYHFITSVSNRYVDLWYYYPWSGRDITGKEKYLVTKAIASFKLLE